MSHTVPLSLLARALAALIVVLTILGSAVAAEGGAGPAPCETRVETRSAGQDMAEDLSDLLDHVLCQIGSSILPSTDELKGPALAGADHAARRERLPQRWVPPAERPPRPDVARLPSLPG